MATNKLNKRVSYFTHVDGNSITMPIYDILRDFGKFEKDLILKIRNEPDPKVQNRLKLGLPCFIPAGIFSRGKAEGKVQFSNLICLDIDWKDNLNVEGFDRLKERIQELPYVAYCGLSVRGKGYYCVVPIINPESFKRHYFSLEQEFHQLYGIKIDPSSANIVQKRFVSYDPEPYINPHAQWYMKFAGEPAKSDSTSAIVNENDINPEILAQVKHYIDIIVKNEVDITAVYNEWIDIAYAFVNTFGETGREMFHDVSRFYPGYTHFATDRKYDEILKSCKVDYIGKATISTFLFHCRKAGLDQITNPWATE